MLLNFGHTLGHAYELAGHYTEWSHGAAVAAGMRRRPAGCTPGVTPAELPERLEEALSALGLPTAIPARRRITPPPWDWTRRGGEDISVIRLERMGRAVPTGCPRPNCWRNCDERHHHPAALGGAVTPPPSKSQAHRLIIAAALSDGVCRLSNVELSQDIQATLRCMRTLDADAPPTAQSSAGRPGGRLRDARRRSWTAASRAPL